ncbi:MAG: hypothetical protein QHH13_03725 [Melioribacter sp.]|uniref:hypothetical protein n=1 Tax=Rosettibacter primus TaxID=3111523 RepID=UPI00247BD66A|nr:hypothetical protein [Melioribacter sp.]
MSNKNFLFFIIMYLTISLIYAQESNYILNVKLSESKINNPINISVDLISAENISSIEFAYRFFDKNEFTKREMQIAGITATVTIPAEEVKPPTLEYYFIINLKDGTTETYPTGIEQGISPFQLAIAGETEKGKEIIILSPEEGEVLTRENFLISVSFIRAPSNIDVEKTKVYLNDIDISQNKLIAEDLIVINGENITDIKYGSAEIKIEVYDNKGNLYYTAKRSVLIATKEVAEKISKRWNVNGHLRAESRNENYSSASTWYNNFSAEAKLTSDQWLFSGQLYVTSEEKKYLQPYNRYTLTIRHKDLLNLQIGDSYPQFPNLIMNGKRVRGFNGALNLGKINLQTAFGETERKIEGTLLQTYLREEAPLAFDVIKINESKYGYPYGRVQFGTYKRDIFVVRPSFGSGKNFQLGFTYLHSKDDPNSVEFASRPQENAVFGTDLMFAIDKQNIMFTSQAAFSVFNKDISSGTLSDAKIDSIFGEGSAFDIDPDQIKTIKKILGKFITVNQYIGPLNPQKLASLAGEAALNINYFNNSLKASYIYRGNDYLSLGQSFIQTDIKGFNFSDQIRMFDNRFFLSVGYEKLEDNLQKTKIATTTYETFSATASIFTRLNFPNISVGYYRKKNNNGLSIRDPLFNKYVIDEITNRFTFLMSYDLKLYVRHNTSLSISTQRRDDKSLRDYDANFNSVSFSVNSYWKNNLNSVFQIFYSSTEIGNSQFKYFTLTAGAKYKLMENKLIFSATLSPSFGDFKRQALELIADYNLIGNLNLAFQARIFRFPGKSTNSIIGLTTRYVL